MQSRLYLGRFLAVFYLVLITLLTLLRRDLSIRADEISKLLIGPYRPVAVTAFIVLSVGACLIAISLGDATSFKIKALLLATSAAAAAPTRWWSR